MAEVLFVERTRLGWSRAKLAELAKIDKSTIYRIETSRSSPDSVTTAALDAALGLRGQMVAAAAVTSDVTGPNETPAGERNAKSLGEEEQLAVMWGFIDGEIAQLPQDVRARARSEVRQAIEKALQPFLKGVETGQPGARKAK